MTTKVLRVKVGNQFNHPAGDLKAEIGEIVSLRESKNPDAIYTITVGCSGFLTLICC